MIALTDEQGYPGENVVRPPHRWSSRDSILVKYCYKLLCIGLWYTAYPSVHSSQICYKQIGIPATAASDQNAPTDTIVN